MHLPEPPRPVWPPTRGDLAMCAALAILVPVIGPRLVAEPSGWVLGGATLAGASGAVFLILALVSGRWSAFAGVLLFLHMPSMVDRFQEIPITVTIVEATALAAVAGSVFAAGIARETRFSPVGWLMAAALLIPSTVVIANSEQALWSCPLMASALLGSAVGIGWRAIAPLALASLVALTAWWAGAADRFLHWPGWANVTAGMRAEYWDAWGWPWPPAVILMVGWGLYRTVRRGQKCLRRKHVPVTWLLTVWGLALLAAGCLPATTAPKAVPLPVSAAVSVLMTFAVADQLHSISERLVLRPPGEREDED